MTSALGVVAFTFAFGLIKRTAPLAIGVAVGVGTVLVFAAANASLSAWSSSTLNTGRLVANGLICFAAVVMLFARCEGHIERAE